MDLVKLHATKVIHRYLLHFYTLTTKDQKQRFKKQFHLLLYQKEKKCLGINLPKKTNLYSKNYDVDERNWRRHKLMERYTMFVDWKNQYCQSHYATQGNLQILCASAAKSLQLGPTLCDPIEGSQTGSPIPGVLQARTLEWITISFSNAWKWKVKVKSLSCVQLLVTPWTAAYQTPPSMGLSRQEYWSGVHCLLCRFNVSPIKLPMAFFLELELKKSYFFS